MQKPPLQYFFPKWSKPGPPAALASRFEMAMNRSNANAKGPNDLRGTLFSPYENTFPIFDADRQRWQSFAYLDEKGVEQPYFIGVDKECSSGDFERVRMIPGGRPIELEHGFWTIPVANPLVESCQLPYFEVPDGVGGWYKEYKEQYSECSRVAVRLAGQLREVFIQREGGSVRPEIELDEDEFRHFIATMIGVNYDLTINEMGALRLFDKEKYNELMFAFLDVETMLTMIVQETEEANGTLNPFPAPPNGSISDYGGADSLSPE